ncbi:MAG: succinate dehydrogenase, cytochrome b556 subunit [Pseudomonadota bacterium]
MFVNGRPVYLNLLKIRWPLPALVSGLHRISGVVLFLAIPVGLLLLDQSLANPEGFSAVKGLLAHPFLKLILAGMIWALCHHLFAGMRFFLMDLDLFMERSQARRSAALAAAAGGLSALILIVRLLS